MRSAFTISLAIAAAVLGCDTSSAAAQDASDSAAYRAITQTPVGALPLLLDAGSSRVPGRAVSFHTRYGVMSYDNREYVHDFGVGVSIPAGSASIGITAGYYWPNCNGRCSGHSMFSASLSQGLANVSLGNGSGVLGIGLNGEVGYARQDATMFSGQMALPVSLVPTGRSLRLVPYVAPGLGVGMVRDDSGTEAGLLFTFGTGLGLVTSRGFMATVGIRRAFLSTGNWLAGAGIAFGPGR